MFGKNLLEWVLAHFKLDERTPDEMKIDTKKELLDQIFF